VNGRPPRLSALRLLAGVVLPLVSENVAKLNPDNRDIAARLADPARRRTLTILTAIIAATFAIDGASQIALALTVPTGSFVPDSTAARIVVLGTGAVLTIQYFRLQKKRPDRGPRPPAHAEHDQ
jgi:hypothetical protein